MITQVTSWVASPFARCVTIGIVVMPSACASSGLVSSWQAPDARPLRVSGSKLAALVMMRHEASRRAAEDALAREITARGAVGVPMYTISPEVNPDNEAEVRAALEQAAVAGVVVMRPVDTQLHIVSTPIMFSGPPYGMFWGGYYRHG